MSPRLIRTADWLLAADRSGSGPVFEAECTTCGDTSGAFDDDQDATEIWCLRHAGLTRHTGFRGITTSFLRATSGQ
ncbi:hypothetical protein J7I97_24795 [Streptomyces sp. ISL-87]|nr:hypothetical protein [Streptomyces sp. ISL-21]MBT2611388.1 hypothetical protein [Streptomyces sp. ISL-87]